MLNLSGRVSEVFEPAANESLLCVLSKYNKASACHAIFTNSATSASIFSKVGSFYDNLDFLEKPIDAVQKACSEDVADQMMNEYSMKFLPIYSNAVEKGNISTDSLSRIYHDPKDYLDNGSPNTEELTSFLKYTTRAMLGSLVKKKEISTFFEKTSYCEKLVRSTDKNDKVLRKAELDIEYDLANKVAKAASSSNEAGIREVCSEVHQSFSTFLIHFGLHLIRKHMFVSYGLDGAIKFFVRSMYTTAVDNLRNKVVNMRTFASEMKPLKHKGVKAEAPSVEATTSKTSLKKEKRSRKESEESVESVLLKTKVKREKRAREESESDDCQIIDPNAVAKKSTPTRIPTSSKLPEKIENRVSVDTNVKVASTLPEDEVLENLNADSSIPVYFKMAFKTVLDHNASIRKQNETLNQLTQFRIAKQKKQIENT